MSVRAENVNVLSLSVSRRNWNAFVTIVRREISRILRIWGQTVVPPAITMSLYFAIFGKLIGSRIGQMGGFSYMDFIVPGLIMMSVITSSYSNVVSSFFGAKFGKHVEEMLVSPMPNYVILAGYVSGGMARGLMVGGVVSLVALAFTDVRVHSMPVTLSVVLLTSVVFSLLGMINAIFARKFDDIAIIPTFILTPLTYLGGVFYSIQLLPEFWQKASLLNPILYMVNAFRYGILGVSDINVVYAYAMILVFGVILTVVCLYLLRAGIGLRS
ncbi:MAG: ABC transporter permease [Gammaproteobacteria bacterium]|nr:MAG: ABC transporter permease [Gammaproteobacteria bacterium]